MDKTVRDFEKWYCNCNAREVSVGLRSMVVGKEMCLWDADGNVERWVVCPKRLNATYIDKWFTDSDSILALCIRLVCGQEKLDEYFCIREDEFNDGYLTKMLERHGITCYRRLYYDRKVCLQELIRLKVMDLERISRELKDYSYELEELLNQC